ncbi:MAG: protein-L-isoaspartate O-methyltransferase [Rhodocyclaceae bacterium]|nr:protein-L-isoaspartate O-methyltransferase [Rhodocyclaceae bacterium]MDZ4215956.1 protein-L-isoaspartate O-methyltransferase [Rhodocyclaceae bacterium]
MNYELARHHMIQQQLRTCERMSLETVALLYADRREHYVPAACRAMAFADSEIPLGRGATMFTPKLETRILEMCALKHGDRVLEIGAGSGHLASLLAEVVDHVWTVEIDPTLAEMARCNLDADRVVNVSVEVGDGLAGLAERAPFDVIVVSGGVTEIPAVLKAQLAEGGRLIAIVGSGPAMRLQRLTRMGSEHLVTEDLMETSVAMLQQSAKAAFSF